MIEGIINSAGEYFSVLGNASLCYVALAFFTYYISVLLYALRWKLVLKSLGRDVPFGELVKAILASIFMNNVTPLSRSGGELLRVAWVSRRASVPSGISAISIVYERILETIPVFMLFMLGAAYFSRESLPLIAVGLVGVALLWFRWDSFVRISLRLFKTEVGEGEIDGIVGLRSCREVNLAGVGLSSLVWLLDVVRLKLIAMALGLSLSWGFVALVSVANLLFGLVAFTPGGVGIIEGGLVGTLAHFGVPFPFAVSMTLVERFVSYVVSTIVGLIVLVSSGGVEIWRALKSQ